MKARYLKVKVAGKDEGILGDMNSIFEDSNYLLHYKDIHQVLNTTNQRHIFILPSFIFLSLIFSQNQLSILSFETKILETEKKKEKKRPSLA